MCLCEQYALRVFVSYAYSRDKDEDDVDAKFPPISDAADRTASSRGDEDESAFLGSISSMALSRSSVLPMRQLKKFSRGDSPSHTPTLPGARWHGQ